jgi:hypothetical protein
MAVLKENYFVFVIREAITRAGSGCFQTELLDHVFRSRRFTFTARRCVASRVAEALREKTEAFGVDLTEPFVPCDSKLYTARRRQQRLSFCVQLGLSG